MRLNRSCVCLCVCVCVCVRLWIFHLLKISKSQIYKNPRTRLFYGEGNGNPLQCSCLENPKDDGAWWAAIYGSHRVGQDWSELAAAAANSSNSFEEMQMNMCLAAI